MNSSVPALALTQSEISILKLLQYVECLADPLVEGQPRRLGGSLLMPDEAVFTLRIHGVAKPHRVSPGPQPGFKNVYFTVDQLFRYVEFGCARLGLNINLDGTITTKSGQTLTLSEVPSN